MDPAAAFPAVASPPGPSELACVLGKASSCYELAIDALRAVAPTAAAEWKFSSRSGWYQIHSLKGRRLLYVIPRRGDFRISLLLGSKALAQVRRGPQARAVDNLLKTAPRYPEGTAFSFDRSSFSPDPFIALLEAKLFA